MTDRELLKLAAKAAGIAVHRLDYDEYYTSPWNPLTNDGDALQLAVKLGIDLVISTSKPARTAAFIPEKFELDDCMEEPHDNNPYAATRRAIVRAAAEVGKDVK